MSRPSLDPRRWPVTIRVPLLVALLMVAVSAAISERVLTRLSDTQARHLSQLGDAYLDGLSHSLIPAVLRRDVWETFDHIDRAAGLYGGLELVRTVVTDADGNVLASSDPRELPTGAPLSREFIERFPAGGGLAADMETARAYLYRDLVHQQRSIGGIHAVIDIGHMTGERREVLTTLVLTNAAITLLLALVGYVAVTRMVRPLRVLSDHLRQGADGDVAPIDAAAAAGGADARRLFGSYNALVRAVTEREALAGKLAEEKRHASLGRLASGMAHEINNPLGGLFNAIDTLKRHGDRPAVRSGSIDLLERGLLGIRQVVRAALVSYRADEPERGLRPDDIEDIRLLAGPELRRRSLSLNWTNGIEGEIDVDASAVRQMVLNLMLNACAASPEASVVAFTARLHDGRLSIAVDDSGPGLPDEARDYLVSAGPVDGPMEPGSRLGLWLVRRLAEATETVVRAGPSELGGARIVLDIPVAAKEVLADVA